MAAIEEDVGGWQLVLEDDPRQAVAAATAVGVLLGFATLVGFAVVGQWALIGLVLTAVGSVGAFAVARQSIASRRVVVRRHGDQVTCDVGGERRWTAPLGEIGYVAVEPFHDGTGRLVVHRKATSRWYDLPGRHPLDAVEAIRTRLIAEAPHAEREQDEPDEVRRLRQGVVTEG